MLLELLVKIISEPCFNNLRTKEQLGYIVSSGIRRANGVQGLRIIVQSDKHPKYVDQRVEAFVHFIKTYLESLSNTEFERHKESLAAQRLEKPKRLAALSARYWAEITTQQYNFDRANIEVAHLRTLEKHDIIEFYDALVSAQSKQRRKLSIHVLSMAEGGAGTLSKHDEAGADGVTGLPSPPGYAEPILIESITEFKSSQAMYPLLQPFIKIPKPSNTKAKL